MKKSQPLSSRPADGFVPLKTLTKGPADPQAALAEIRRIYFNTSRQTIANDFVHAIELLKSLANEDQREKATVYMEGLAQMRSDWERDQGRKGKVRRGGASHRSGSRGR